MLEGIGYEDRFVSAQEAEGVVRRGLESFNLQGKKVLVIIPDHTRTAPIGMMFRALYDVLAGVVDKLDYLVALGTHPPMTEAAIYERVEITAQEHKTKFPKVRFFNHDWKNPDALMKVGTFARKTVEEITEGRFSLEVPVTVNRMLFDYDLLLICGPVFPHEVVGFSGGCKYMFPGVSGEEIINFFHWLGAVITNPVIIGTKYTPVRAVVERAAAMVNVPKFCIGLVVKGDGLAGIYAGDPQEAWSSAADLSDKLHIVYKYRPYRSILSCAPKMYDDIWTAGKCMYKLEPVVADGGELIIYAPHVTEISYTHGKILDEVGYHTRDYFLAQWDAFKHYPWGVLAHSTHVKGIGKYENGVEKPRVNVTLATGIPEARCRKVNLGYRDPVAINPDDWKGREEEGVLLVPKAGEMLFRLKNDPFRK
ncbi:MAG TPA: lactate racemase domain-containing protein [Candidatus Brocadiia bacterium]|nr:lactate racemase domain-containing protein [Candidatus Brocadiia bacterium]